MRRELCELVRLGVMDLPEPHRQTVLLRLAEPLSWQEIGTATGTSAEGARKPHERALPLLQPTTSLRTLAAA